MEIKKSLRDSLENGLVSTGPISSSRWNRRRKYSPLVGRKARRSNCKKSVKGLFEELDRIPTTYVHVDGWAGLGV
eukprot:scaffold183_cov174-Ochromonas_danica.AAC.5